MNFAHAEKIAAAVLYEGYILYPYRATSIKNVQRWNFGTLYPRAYAEAQSPAEKFRLRAECVIESTSNATINVRVRFLQLARQQAPDKPDWEVGVERTIECNDLRLSDLAATPLHRSFSFPDAQKPAPAEVSPEPIAGECELRVDALRDGLYKLSLQVSNVSPLEHVGEIARGAAMLQSFVSAHALLGIEEGAFVSLLETPSSLSAAVADCQNIGVFPVLVGEPGERTTMLCSPIILYDYPQIAPESLGDFFDGTEMDEMLALRVLTLTQEEKQEMRETDGRASRILERTELLPEEQLAKVHGAIRGMRPVLHDNSWHDAEVALQTGNAEWDPFAERPPLQSVTVFGVELRAGSRVRLWPQKQADIMDMALEGKVAVIEAIEQDLEDNVQLAVVVDDDPGREFGMLRQPGHRFFFSPDEVEPLPSAPDLSDATTEVA